MINETTLTICGLCKKRETENSEDKYCFNCEEKLFEIQQEVREEQEENERLQNGY